MKWDTIKEVEAIRKLSAIADNKKAIPKEWLKIIYAKKLFKLFVPKESGGLMLPLPDALKVFDQAGQIDGNFGWAITIGSGGGYFYGYMKPEVAAKVFNNPKAVIAGSGALTAMSDKVNGGYSVNGSWAYCSGAPYATSFTANALIGKGKWRSFIFEPTQVDVYKDWNAFGLRATESYGISVNDVFVPDEMTFDLLGKTSYRHVLYSYPFLQFAELSFAALTIGLCRHFFEEAHNIMFTQKIKWGKTQGRYLFVKRLVSRNEKEFESVSEEFYDMVEVSWKEMKRKGKISAETQMAVSEVSKRTSRVVLSSIDNVMQYMGMGAVMETSTINRIWRDTHTACQHILLVPFNKS